MLQFQAGVAGDRSWGPCCLLPDPEGGSGDWHAVLSGEERVFRPKPAVMEVILVDGGMFLEMAWHDMYFAEENKLVYGQIG
ncbi:MAG: hypothetical protein OXC82_05165 [Rhodobacteraceae bacterium]|nr:hypothetical protein [Paracoccaceae bacterium]MCY4249812.1 hypothetical protein [Paracoccaceae bacterium]